MIKKKKPLMSQGYLNVENELMGTLQSLYF